jgi:hypothetical protein
MLKDEFSRLLALFADGAEGKPVNLQQIFAESLVFFEHLNEQIKNGTPEEKKEALRMMNEMYAEMIKETKKICDKTGLTEEQLNAFSENPNNFSQEQWKGIQEAKEKIVQVGKTIGQSLSSVEIPNATKDKGPFPEPAEKEKKTPTKKSKKSQWMRS